MSALAQKPYGFKWGPVEVRRTTSVVRKSGDDPHLVITIETDAGQSIDIYASPTGRSVRVFGKGGEWVAMSELGALITAYEERARIAASATLGMPVGEFYVLHCGVGRDGGFGDYAGAYWSDNPVSLNGETVWFTSEADAKRAADLLSKAARSVHNYVSYSGDFPTEYEYRRIVVPDGPPMSDPEQLAWLVAEQDQDGWNRGWEGYSDDECCDEDCEPDCAYCGDVDEVDK